MQEYLDKIKNLAKKIKREVKLMEVCGTHTQVIAESGIKEILPQNVKLISGPGCPVCVTSRNDIDAVVKLAISGVPIATYGDMIRVKGSKMSLADAREMGAKVKEIYGVEELLKFSEEIVFFAIGFETTAPMSASIAKRGKKIYSAHKAFIPAMKTLLANGEIKVDGLISPGHVAAIVGSDAFCDFKTHYSGCGNGAMLRSFYGNIPQAITGFEMSDVLKGIIMLLCQIIEGRAEVENEYKRVVRAEGNKKAIKLIDEVFEIKNSDWRGLGIIHNSGFELRAKYANIDAKEIYRNLLNARSDFNNSLTPSSSEDCLCAEVIKGNIEPAKCPNFNKKCAPENPQGPCMVSREGACSIAYKNGLGIKGLSPNTSLS
ncbi:MAG: hydrogenase formation protein HypD [bacterium]